MRTLLKGAFRSSREEFPKPLSAVGEAGWRGAGAPPAASPGALQLVSFHLMLENLSHMLPSAVPVCLIRDPLLSSLDISPAVGSSQHSFQQLAHPVMWSPDPLKQRQAPSGPFLWTLLS